MKQIFSFILFSISRRSPSLSCRYISSHSKLIERLNMPREIDQELKKTRLKIKEKSLKYPPGTVTLQVLGSGAPGAPRSLYVCTGQSRYLFNVGEGSQRLAHEHKMKLSKLEHIFVTTPIWENIGGLPGVALTIQDVGVPEITLHGPEGTDDIFPATRRFVVLKDLSIKMAKCTKDVKFEDNVMTVNYVPISAEKSESIHLKSPNSSILVNEADDVDYYGHERRMNGGPPRAAIVQHEPLEQVNDRIPSVVMCYICKLKTRPGTLNPEACAERGVPPGPLLGRLKNGEDITLPNGTVVRSCDVTTPDDPGPVFLVADCPSAEYLNVLTSDTSFEPYYIGGEAELQPYSMVHFTPQKIVDSDQYQTWIKKFSPSTIHVFINSENKCTGSIAVHRIQHKMNLLHPQIFPCLQDTLSEVSESCDTTNVRACTLASVHLRPLNGLDTSQTLKLNPEEYINEEFNTEEFREELHKLKVETNSAATEEKFPKITFLGTGSCIPNKTRNTSGILVYTSPNECAILDCGEGTFNQISRFYGEEGTKRVMSELKMIYVSHLHADHHIGLVGLLKWRRKLLGSDAEPVFLLAPKQILFWLNFYHTRFEDVLEEFQLIPNDTLLFTSTLSATDDVKCMLERLSYDNVATVYVRHCPNAFGVAITHRSGWKICYSGDTMPCTDLVGLGKDCDILIHEATMEDELEAEARLKYHSTTSQAIQIGKAMDAKFTILTHFSQRYAKLPRLNDGLSNNIGIAFDNMQVSRDQLPILTKMYPALKLMFAEHCKEMDEKANRRNLRNEKKRVASQSPKRPMKVNAS